MSRPFSNGTEGGAWESAWCAYCANDHDVHIDTGGGCDIIAAAMVEPDRLPEPWVPEPDDGRFFLPSRLVCLAFRPCEPCGGDPGAVERAERVAEVQAYWKAKR